MKKMINTLGYSAIIAVLLQSCAVSKITEFQKVLEAKSSKETFDQPFVKTKDGRIITYKSLELKKGPFSAPHLLADGHIKIQTSMIEAYQTHEHFAISQNQLMGGKKSFVAVDALPGFAVRMVKGRLNVYAKKYFNGSAAVDEYYLQLGQDGNIYVYSPEIMKELIRESDAASNYFGQVSKNERLDAKIQNTAEIFNNNNVTTKN
jgi:hypothetical protein